MRKRIVFIVLALVIAAIITAPAYAREYTDAERAEILRVMENSDVTARVIKDVALYADKSGNVRAGEIKEGSYVRIIKDFSARWHYIVETQGDKAGWIRREYLDIPPDPPADVSDAGKYALEGYVNILKTESETPYLILVDIKRQKTHVFYGGKENWSLIKSFPCSTGKNESPTIRGAFKITDRGAWFYSYRLGSGGKYWMRFSGPYMFHSQAMDINRNIIPGSEIGRRESNGCVRLLASDAEWLYENIPDDTAVIID